MAGKLILFFVATLLLDSRPLAFAEETLPAQTASWLKPVSPILEKNSQLWALLQYESQFGSINFNSLLRFGDFASCNLRGVRAMGFNLARFNFSKSDLRGADLRGADLTGANFRGADLREAIFVSTKETGITYDDQTKLPFPESEARIRGWVRVKR